MASEAVFSDDIKALLASQPKTKVLREYHWTAPMFYRALDAGAFGFWPKVELIRGKIIEHPSQTPRHGYMVGKIGRCFRNVLEPVLQVREHSPIAIADDTHADADVLVIINHASDYWERHPGPDDTKLLVEASDLTIDYDLGEKSLVYSQAGIVDYWVVLVNDLVVVRHREPTAEGYSEITWLTKNDTISPLAMPEVAWTVNKLLGWEE